MSSFISVIHRISSHLSQNTLINWLLYFYLFNNCFIMTKLNIFSVFSFVIDFLFSVCARNKTIQRCFSYNWRNIKNHAISSGLDRILIIVRDIFMYIQIWDYKNLYLFDLYLNLASFYCENFLPLHIWERFFFIQSHLLHCFKLAVYAFNEKN